MKKRLLQGLQVAVTLSVLGWLFHDPNKRHAMAGALGKANGVWLAGAFLSGLIGELTGMVRWQFFLKVQRLPCRWRDVARWFFIGLFFNMVLPGTTGGDLVRLYYLCRAFPQRRADALVVLFNERIVSMIPLILLTVGTTLWNYRWLTGTPASAGLLYTTLAFCAGSALLIAAVVVFSATQRGQALPGWLPGRDFLARAIAALHRFGGNRRSFLLAVALSVPGLLCYYTGYYCVSEALGAGRTYNELLSILPIVTVITSIPISVGGLGVREGLFERLLGDLCGTPGELASLISLTGYAIFLSFGLIGAAVYACTPPVDRRALEGLQKEAEQ